MIVFCYRYMVSNLFTRTWCASIVFSFKHYFHVLGFLRDKSSLHRAIVIGIDIINTNLSNRRWQCSVNILISQKTNDSVSKVAMIGMYIIRNTMIYICSIFISLGLFIFMVVLLLVVKRLFLHIFYYINYYRFIYFSVSYMHTIKVCSLLICFPSFFYK